MKKLYIVLISILISSLAFGASEIRKITQEDLQVGPAGGAYTSPGGHTGHTIPRYWDNNAFSDNLTLHSNDLITGGPWVDVRKFGTALTDAPIRAAVDNTSDATGMDMFIPAGTYVISNPVSFIDKNKVRLRGAGKDRTTLDSSGVTWPAAYTQSWQGHFGTLVFDTSSAGSYVESIYVSDMTIKSNISDTNAHRKGVFVGNVKEVTFERVKFTSTYWEALNFISDQVTSRTFPRRIRIIDCDFTDIRTNGVDFNNAFIEDVIISENFFDNVATAINASIGKNLIISSNVIRNTSGQRAKAVTDRTDTVAPSTLSATVANNTIIGLGKNYLASGGPTHYAGIVVQNILNQFYDNSVYGNIVDNNTYDSPVFVIGNSIVDSVAPPGKPVYAFIVSAKAKLTGNIVSGIRGDASSSVAFLIQRANTDNIALRQDVILEHNTVARTPHDNVWYSGVYAAANDNIYLMMSGNNISGATNALYSPGSGGVYPFISLDGDILNGIINASSTWSSLNSSGSMNDTPLHGKNSGNITSAYSKGYIQKTLDNTATPSVSGHSLFALNAENATITDLTNGVAGQIIHILAVDNNANAMTDSGNLKLNGTWAPTALFQTITLWCFDGTTWLELSRSTN